MLGHPDCDDPDRLLAAARCGLAEWSVDDHYVDIEGDDAEPELIGLRLALAHAVVDPVRLPARYAADFEKVVVGDPVLKAFRSCLAHLQRYASTTQVARLRHELAVMFVAYGQEAEWRAHKRRPPVWEYLLHRYENAFFPCMVLVDPIGGYELPPQEFANPAVRRAYLLAGRASVILNDIYSMGVEDPTDTNLPGLIASRGELLAPGGRRSVRRRYMTRRCTPTRRRRRRSALPVRRSCAASSRACGHGWAERSGGTRPHRVTSKHEKPLISKRRGVSVHGSTGPQQSLPAIRRRLLERGAEPRQPSPR